MISAVTRLATSGRAVAEVRHLKSALTFLAINTVVSVLYSVSATHQVVTQCCEYRGADLFTAHWYKLVGAPFLEPSTWELIVGGLFLLIVMAALESLAGPLVTFSVAVVAPLLAALAIDSALKLSGNQAALNAVDTGSSVSMVAIAAVLIVMTKSKRFATIVSTVLIVDIAKNHDLASAEHAVAFILGTVAAFIICALSTRRFGAETN